MSVRTRWRLLAIAAATAAATASLAAAPAVPALGAGPAVPQAAVSIAVKSAVPKISGDTLVVFLGGKYASATVRGTVTGAASGDIATLLARKFGAASYSPAGTPVTLGASPARYSFTVRPQLATRYKVQVSAADSPGTVLGTSAPATVYVTASAALTGSGHCTRPVCHIKLHLWAKVPAAAYRAETAKHWYLYSRLRLAARRIPAPPKVLELDHKATASAPLRLHAYEFRVTLRFTFRIGNHAYRYRIDACTKDSESADGLGLPGRHGCGNKWISATRYLG